MKKILFIATSILLSAAITCDSVVAERGAVTNTWTVAEDSTEATITGGPWTLGQGPTTKAIASVGYCLNGLPQTNPGTNLFQPYYFPLTIGQGLNLQGYFDYRPKDSNEAIVAASSSDGGLTWNFQQEVLELNPGLCPSSDNTTNATTYPSSSTDDGLLSGNDAGQGHPFVLDINRKRFLYTLDRTTNNVDVVGLVIHQLQPTATQPLNPTPPTFDVSTPTKPLSSPQPKHTIGLLNPDGIITEVPGSYPRVVLYLQKQKSADNKGETALTAEQQCAAPPVGADQVGKTPNHDIVTPRLAKTKDGIHFTDLGPVSGLNDSTTVSWTGTRYVGPRGTLIQLPHHRYGFFFSGGNCLDADSDAFHYIGYAESNGDLHNWKVINGINNPIASIKDITVGSNDSSNFGEPINIPANPPVIATQEWFFQRVYSPNATLVPNNQVSLVFAGYKVKGPSSDYSNYRTITHTTLNSSLRLLYGNEKEREGGDKE
ncbi:hypothetical protein NIES4075_65160 [Tolypothrix sp. NIES-4075]|uniref:hypothetical protein n=1 Tax=Tolypothrix sp. NIES-4075 TaxID=2005459 RepID=UPI000B6BC913|nr:hypothetical protein [Tolypothrix sp. NIES-4075]GAX45495.1 hypothetical protein NIES4075_65160 [Tolypothrix sp. NIES-4075]